MKHYFVVMRKDTDTSDEGWAFVEPVKIFEDRKKAVDCIKEMEDPFKKAFTYWEKISENFDTSKKAGPEKVFEYLSNECDGMYKIEFYIYPLTQE